MDVEEVFQDLVGWETLSPYLFALLFVILGAIGARILGRLVERLVLRHRSPHTAILCNKLVFYTLFVAVFLSTLSWLGVELTGLLAAAGILTVALAFAAQTSVSNVISGLFLYFDRPFSIGDTVKVGDILGTVVSIDLLSSRVRTFDNLMIRIPNETLLKSTITNYSLFTVRRIDIPVGVAYGTNLKDCKTVLMDTMTRQSMILDEPAPVVLVDSLGDDGVELVVRAWIERTEFVTAKSQLTQAIYESLGAADIEIPWPQRVVHLRDDLKVLERIGESNEALPADDFGEPDEIEETDEPVI